MDPPTERQVAARLALIRVTVEVESFGVVELRRISVSRPEAQHDLFSCGEGDTGAGDVLAHGSEEVLHGAAMTKAFIDGPWDQGRFRP